MHFYGSILRSKITSFSFYTYVCVCVCMFKLTNSKIDLFAVALFLFVFTSIFTYYSTAENQGCAEGHK